MKWRCRRILLCFLTAHAFLTRFWSSYEAFVRCVMIPVVVFFISTNWTKILCAWELFNQVHITGGPSGTKQSLAGRRRASRSERTPIARTEPRRGRCHSEGAPARRSHGLCPSTPSRPARHCSWLCRVWRTRWRLPRIENAAAWWWAAVMWIERAKCSGCVKCALRSVLLASAAVPSRLLIRECFVCFNVEQCPVTAQQRTKQPPNQQWHRNRHLLLTRSHELKRFDNKHVITFFERGY